jgi:four helix bundle protein
MTITMLKFKTYSFESLDVWKEARKLVKKIYLLTSHFPPEEKFGLVSQMRRAVLSISTNTAEGSSRTSLKDQARFSEIAFGSMLELLNESIVSYDLEYISEDELVDIRLDIDSISSKLTGLKHSQINRHKKIRSIIKKTP